MKVLITGAAGFIGSHLTRRLLQRGDEVRGLLMPDEPDRGLAAEGMEVVRGDLTVPASIATLAEGCDKVVHAAMRVIDWGRKKDFFDLGVDGTRNLLEECGGKVERFVYMSSIAAYGFGPHLKGYDEYVPLVKTGLHYGDAKAEAEQIVGSYAAAAGMEATVIRPANVTGPGSVWVREILDAMHRGPLPLMDGGRWSASLVFVDNLVDGIVAAMDSPAAAGRTYNLRDDYSVTWKEYITWLGGLVGKKSTGSLPFNMAWSLGWIVQTAFLPFGARPPITAQAVGIMGTDNDVSNRRANEELGWKTRIPWEEAKKIIEKWVHENYKPPKKR
ncbi:MAG: NAD-dependent epimerase/dehydratase family protein [Actinomycetota bacterium]|nr:NAD-dependent epimerase/dehydratase family protein [Actinomycetota bacterium]